MKTTEDMIQIYQEREYPVKKANEIIQRAKMDLNLTEQKIFIYAVSKIKPTDKALDVYEFGINDFCDVCGINRNSGSTIDNVKEYIKGMKKKMFWMLNDDEEWETIDWIQKAWVAPKSGKVRIRFDDTMHKYLIDLQGNYTQYSLIGILPMKSAYSLRLFEILKSYAGLRVKEFEIGHLKELLMAPYERFPDFRRKVLDIATREINQYTEIRFTWEPIFKGRKVIKVKFVIETKDTWDRYESYNNASGVLDGQLQLNLDGTITEYRKEDHIRHKKAVEELTELPKLEDEEEIELDKATVEAVQELEQPVDYMVEAPELEEPLLIEVTPKVSEDAEESYKKRIMAYMDKLSDTLGEEQLEKVLKALGSIDE